LHCDRFFVTRTFRRLLLNYIKSAPAEAVRALGKINALFDHTNGSGRPKRQSYAEILSRTERVNRQDWPQNIHAIRKDRPSFCDYAKRMQNGTTGIDVNLALSTARP